MLDDFGCAPCQLGLRVRLCSSMLVCAQCSSSLHLGLPHFAAKVRIASEGKAKSLCRLKFVQNPRKLTPDCLLHTHGTLHGLEEATRSTMNLDAYNIWIWQTTFRRRCLSRQCAPALQALAGLDLLEFVELYRSCRSFLQRNRSPVSFLV